MADAPCHLPVLCVVCGCEAHRYLEVGDLTLYLCPAHVDLCVECLVVSDDSIADKRNICDFCGGDEDCGAELGIYECTPCCSVCKVLGR